MQRIARTSALGRKQLLPTLRFEIPLSPAVSIGPCNTYLKGNHYLLGLIAFRKRGGTYNMTEQEQQTPGIRLRPPLVYAVSLFIGLGIEQLLPLVSIAGTWRAGPAVALIALSGLLIAPTVMRFRKADTPFFDINKCATTLITDGPYRYSRNPGYLALTLLYLGLGVLISSAWVCVLVVPTLLIMNVAVVRKEERHLESQFGEEYLRYKTAVRRWL